MIRQWTFGQKLGGGFAVTVALALAIGVVAIYALRATVATKDRVITEQTQLLTDALRLQNVSESQAGASRGFLLTRDREFIQMFEAEERLFE